MDKVAITKSLLDNLADHINTKAGTTGPKTIEQMQNTVDGIDTAEPMQEKSVEITENGTTEVTPDTGYGGLSKVSITGNVQPNLENGVASISQNGETTITPSDGFDGLSSVQITVDVPATPQTPTEDKTVDLDMAAGNQVVEPTAGYAISKLTINKPDTMLSENIKKDVNIGGVVGSYEGGGSGDLPQLHAPTIAINEDTLTITNPASNGDFVTSYELYNGDAKVGTASGTTVDLTQIFTDEVDYNLTVRCVGTNFESSPSSNNVTYSNIFYAVSSTLIGCETDNSASSVRKGKPYTATLSPLSGYVMTSSTAVITMAGIDITAGCFSITGQNLAGIAISSVTGELSINVTAAEQSLIEWTSDSTLDKGQAGVVYTGNMFVTIPYPVKNNVVYNYISEDGVSWERKQIGSSNYSGQNSYSGDIGALNGTPIWVSRSDNYSLVYAMVDSEWVICARGTDYGLNKYMTKLISSGTRILGYGGGDNGQLYYADEIVTSGSTPMFTAVSLGFNAKAIAYGNGIFLALISSSLNLYRSSDGITWEQASGATYNGYDNILFANGTFYVYRYSYGGHYETTNGDTLKYVSDSGRLTVSAPISYCDGLFVQPNAASYSGDASDVIKVSKDFKTWEDVSMLTSNKWLRFASDGSKNIVGVAQTTRISAATNKGTILYSE